MVLRFSAVLGSSRARARPALARCWLMQSVNAPIPARAPICRHTLLTKPECHCAACLFEQIATHGRRDRRATAAADHGAQERRARSR